MKQKILRDLRHGSLSLSWLLSLVAIVVVPIIFFSSSINIEAKKLMGVGILIGLASVLNLILWSFKRRAMFDPKLNMIRINSVEGMKPYVGRFFLVQNTSPIISTLYLYGEDFGSVQDPLFIAFYPSEINFFVWSKQLKVIGNQRLRGIIFFEENGVMSYKFWTMNSKEEYKFFVKDPVAKVA